MTTTWTPLNTTAEGLLCLLACKQNKFYKVANGELIKLNKWGTKQAVKALPLATSILVISMSATDFILQPKEIGLTVH